MSVSVSVYPQALADKADAANPSFSCRFLLFQLNRDLSEAHTARRELFPLLTADFFAVLLTGRDHWVDEQSSVRFPSLPQGLIDSSSLTGAQQLDFAANLDAVLGAHKSALLAVRRFWCEQ